MRWLLVVQVQIDHFFAFDCWALSKFIKFSLFSLALLWVPKAFLESFKARLVSLREPALRNSMTLFSQEETPPTSEMTWRMSLTLLPSVPLRLAGLIFLAALSATLNLVTGCPLFLPMAITVGCVLAIIDIIFIKLRINKWQDWIMDNIVGIECAVDLIIILMQGQKSLTLTKCKIYNWIVPHKQPIQLTLQDSTGTPIYDKIYHSFVVNQQVVIRLAIKLTFTPDDKEIIFALKNAAGDQNDQKAIRFVVDFEKLTGEQNFFKTDLDDCIVNLLAEKTIPLQLPSIQLKNKNQEIQAFIKQREEYLKRLQRQVMNNKNQSKESPEHIMEKTMMKDTPYFQKEEKNPQRNNQSQKIKGLIAKARELRNQQNLNSKNPQRFQEFNTSTYPSLSDMSLQEKLEKQEMYDYQDGSESIQHFHEHKHFVCNNPTAYEKNFTRQPRTNDSYSVYSSRSQQFVETLHKNTSQYRCFDVKAPFKQKFL